jgi:Concanavalin A-like lectin/glucanases superfamily/Domain of unknown function (DUF2341)
MSAVAPPPQALAAPGALQRGIGVTIPAMRRGLLHGAVLVVVACEGGSYFECADDRECAAQGGEGVCQPAGACSFPDDACPSGQRYGAASEPPLAGECVPTDQGTTFGPDDPSTSTVGSGSAGDLSDTTGDTTFDPCPASWWDCAWAHRQRLTLADPVQGSLTDVPLLVLLVAGRVDHERMQADGEDVRFVAASGAVVPHEIERWDPAGVSSIWINVDALGGAADHVWIYYGNPVAENAQDPAGVWPDPFVGVWHLEDDPIDASPQGNDATAAGTTTVVEGHVGHGRSFGSANARLDVGAPPSATDLFADGGTVSAWIRARSWGGGGFGRIADKDASSTGWLFYVATQGKLRFHVWAGPDTDVIWETVPDVIGLHRWIHVAVTYDTQGSIPQVFVDGLEVALVDPLPPPMVAKVPSDLEIPLTLGNRPANDRRFDGILDEVRLERTTRSAEWIRVQHDTMRDALFDYGPIESWEGGP